MEKLRQRLMDASDHLNSVPEEWAQEAGNTLKKVHGLLDRPIEDAAFELVEMVHSLAAVKERLESVSPEAAETVDELRGWTMNAFTDAARMVET